MVNYIAYEPTREIQFEPTEGTRYFFGTDGTDWVQIFPVDQRLDVPFRFCASISNQLIGATTLYGKTSTANTYLTTRDGEKQERFLKVDKVPAAVFGTAARYTPRVIRTLAEQDVTPSDFILALDAMASAIVAHSSKHTPRDVSGIALPENILAKPRA
jgi:hypothetical protein